MNFRSITRKQLYGVLILLVLIMMVLLVERVVVTDRERVNAAISTMRDAARMADVEVLLGVVSEDYYDGMFGRDGLRDLVESYFAAYGGTHVRILNRAVSLSGSHATVELRVFAATTRGARRGPFGRSTWLIFLQEEPDNVWRVTRVEPISWEGRDVTNWSTLRRVGRF